MAPAEVTPPRRADVPEEPAGGRTGLSLEDWRARHAAQLQAPGRNQARIVVLGDSLADGWARSKSFQKQWRKERPLNLALPGDQTQQLLWRIEQGALDGLAPRLTVILAGMENLTAGFSPKQTATGVKALLEQVRARLPQSAVLVVGLLPAGPTAGDPLRTHIAEVNRELAALAEPERVVVADVGGMFLDADGTLSGGVLDDDLHPTQLGYQALTTALSIVAQQLLRNTAAQ